MSRKKIVIILAIVFAVIYSSLYYSLRPQAVDNDMWIFNTPDEVANYYFIEQLSQNNTLRVGEPLNEISGATNLVHPRSTKVVDNHIVPGSFLGFILLLGYLAKVVGMGAIIFITPVVSILAVLCFYKLIRDIFDRNIAFFSALGLLVMPAFWYYNSRLMLNNVLFIDFIIISLYLLMSYFSSQKILRFALSALFIGAAVSIRPAEVLWPAILYLAIFILYRNKLKIWHWFLFGGLALLPILPSLYFQQQIFGGIFTTGYAPGLKAGGGSAAQSNIFKNLIIPFGFNIKAMLSGFYHYFIKMFWWYAVPAALGLGLMVYQWKENKIDKKKITYVSLAIFVSLFILVYYGSWSFTNNLAGLPLIGSSQVRYFLPIYILAVPLAIYFLSWLIKLIKDVKTQKMIIVAVTILVLALSSKAVLSRDQESLNNMKQNILSYHEINKQIREIVPENGVIVSSYNDKLFFPQRKTIFIWRDEKFLTSIEDIAREVPVYFYSIDPVQELNIIEDYSELEMEYVVDINQTESLYKLK